MTSKYSNCFLANSDIVRSCLRRKFSYNLFLSDLCTNVLCTTVKVRCIVILIRATLAFYCHEWKVVVEMAIGGSN